MNEKIMFHVLSIVMFFVRAWLVMLLIGMLYHEVEIGKPLGYWVTLGATYLATLIGGAFNSAIYENTYFIRRGWE